MNTPILLNNWAGGSVEDVFNDFAGSRWGGYRESKVKDREEFAGVEILLASYGTPSYEGYGFVLFRRDGKLFEVNSSHCSCYGLEGQWEPEETTLESLLHRLNNGSLGQAGYQENNFADELRQLLATLTPPPEPFRS